MFAEVSNEEREVDDGSAGVVCWMRGEGKKEDKKCEGVTGLELYSRVADACRQCPRGS